LDVSYVSDDAEGELYVCAFDRLDGRQGRIYCFVEA
jgi:hypothetical protein